MPRPVRTEHCTLYRGDCRDVLPGLDPAAVALVLTDPPYGVALANHARERCMDGTARRRVRDWSIAGDGGHEVALSVASSKYPNDVNQLTTASNSAFAENSRMSAWTYFTGSGCRRASSRNFGLLSTPSTRQPARASRRAMRP